MTIIKDYNQPNCHKIEELYKELNALYKKLQSLKDACFEKRTDVYKGMNIVNSIEEVIRNKETKIEEYKKLQDLQSITKSTETKTEKKKDFTKTTFNVENIQKQNSLSDNNPTIKDYLSKKHKRKISNVTKGTKKIRIDNDINSTFHKIMKNCSLYISIKLKQIYGNEKYIKIGINNINIINNTKKEKFLSETIINNIIIYKPRKSNEDYGENIIQKIEDMLNVNILGKEEEIKNLKFFLNMPTSKVYNMYMNDEDFFTNENQKKINISGFKTFKNDFGHYEVERQRLIKERAKKLLKRESEKRCPRKKNDC